MLLRAPGAPRERQTAAAGVYSGAMMMPPPYRPATSPAAGFGAEVLLNRAIYASRRGVPSKKRNFVRVLSNSAPSPIVPAGKLYTTQTMLPSGKNFKMRNFGGVLSNSSPVIASPFAPGGSRSSSCPLPTANCLLPTANCYFPQPPCPSPQKKAASSGSPSPPAWMRPAAACRGGCPARCGGPGKGPGPSPGLSCCSRGGRCSCGHGR